MLLPMPSMEIRRGDEKTPPCERFTIVDMGCKVNRYDGEVVRAELRRIGLEESTDFGIADLLVLNACAVTDRAVRRGRQALRAMRRRNPGARLLVTGCFTSHDRDQYAALSTIGRDEAEHGMLFAPVKDGSKLRDLLATWWPNTATAANPSRDPFALAFEDRTRAYLKVQDGCDAKCAFCIIPSIRGAVRSKPLLEVVAEARAALARGFVEIVVCGIHLGHYGRDVDLDLTHLLDALEGIGVEGDRDGAPRFRFRLGSLEATEVNVDLARRLGLSRVLAPHLHVPLQSGDDAILGAMRRPYTVASFERRIAEIRNVVPDIAMSSDVIVGFPGETDAAFEHTLEAVERMRFMKTHVFPFSPRAGTPAALLPQRIPADVVRSRVRKLLALDSRLREEFDRSRRGAAARVVVHEIVETAKGPYSRGLCERFRTVFVPGRHAIAEFVDCTILGRCPDDSVVGTREDLLGETANGSTHVES